jgi:hypothetical protein
MRNKNTGSGTLKKHLNQHRAGDDKPGYYDGENYRWLGRPVRVNTPGLAKAMNINASFLFISFIIAYFTLPWFLYYIGAFPSFPDIQMAYYFFFFAGTGIALTCLFTYHKYRMEYKRCAICNKNQKGCDKSHAAKHFRGNRRK